LIKQKLKCPDQVDASSDTEITHFIYQTCTYNYKFIVLGPINTFCFCGVHFLAKSQSLMVEKPSVPNSAPLVWMEAWLFGM